MKQFLIPKVKPGDEITAQLFNALRQAIIETTIIPGLSVGIQVTQTNAGTMISVRSTQRYVGITTSTITARSGTTPGSGTVELYLYSTPNDDLEDTGQEVTVRSFSSTTGGIPTSTYCFVEDDLDNNFWITSVDCGN